MIPDISDKRDGQGFRLRGLDMTRTETFTDAAFAFAVTLLVVSIDEIPNSVDDMMDSMKGVPAFLMSFAQLAMFWYAHWKWSRRYGLEDLPTIVLSLALVFLTLCYVYPLKFIFTGFATFFSGGALRPDGFMENAVGVGPMYESFAIYSIGFAAMSLIILLLYWHGHRRSTALALSDREVAVTKAEMGAWIVLTGTGVVALLVSLFGPHNFITFPGWVYAALAIIMPVYGITADKFIMKHPVESAPATRTERTPDS